MILTEPLDVCGGEDFVFQTGGEWNEVQNELKFVKVLDQILTKFIDHVKTHMQPPNAKNL